MVVEELIRRYAGRQMSRDELLAALSGLGISDWAAQQMAALIDHAATDPSPPAGDPASAPRALSGDEFAILEAIAGRILPATDTPGAIEAGAAHYIDIALAGAYSGLAERYQAGLAALDRYAVAQHGAGFAALDATAQDAVLEAMEAGAIDGFGDAAELFETIRAHVMEGVFCEPYYGGNRNLIGWSLVGFPGMRYGYPESYVDKPVGLTPVALDNRPPREGDP